MTYIIKILRRVLARVSTSCLLGISSFALSTAIFANPVVENVVNGNVSIQQTATTTTVNQTSQKAIINWNSFNIQNGEHTHFNQPNGGVVLNRINPNQGASQIMGQLSATGRIIIYNPAGVFIGPNAFINVGGIIATTKGITDQNFLNGIYKFDQSSAFSGAIVNQGTIIAADNGLVALIGNAVSNEGYIQANLGKVALASGDAFTMSFAGNDMISFVVDEESLQRGVDANGNSLPDGVKNTGTIVANGGQIMVHAKAAAGVLDHVINMEGIVQAQSVQEVNGEIILSADNAVENVVRVAGKLDARGINPGETGGNISVLGYNLLIDEGAELNASGDAGGGNVRVGGNYLGQGPLPNANAVVMAPETSIYADAITNGDGGEIILWSDDYTSVWGDLYARGGSGSGDGGFIETSSKNYLDVSNIGIVDTTAENGITGKWLLDPINITITTSTSNIYDGYSLIQGLWSAQDNDVQLYYDTLTNSSTGRLYSTYVEINTAGPGSTWDNATGNITVNSAVSWNSANSLTLNAHGSIILNANVTNSGSGNLYLKGPVKLNSASVTVGGGGSNVYFQNGYVGQSGSTWTGAYTLTVNGTAHLEQTNNSYGTTSTSGGGITFNQPVILAGTDTSVVIQGKTVFNSTVAGNAYDLTVERYSDNATGISINLGAINVKSFTVKYGLGGGASFYLGSTINTADNNVTLDSGNLITNSANRIASDETLTINGGTVYLLATESINKLVLNGGTIFDNTSTANTISANTYDFRSGSANAVLLGSGGITKTGAGTVSLTRSNLNTGITTVNAGTLNVSNAGGLGSHSTIDVNGGILNINGNNITKGTLYVDNGSVIGTGTLTINVQTRINNAYISANIAGGGDMYQYNTGISTLAGSNSYTGLTKIWDGGTIKISSNSNLGNTSYINLLFNGVLQATSSFTLTKNVQLDSGTTGYINVDSGSTLTASGVFSSNGNLVKTGGGALTLSNSSNTYTGTTLASAGTLTISGSLASTARLESLTGATLNINGSVSPTDIYAHGGTINIGGVIGSGATNRLYIYDGGTIRLTNSNRINDDRSLYYNNNGTNTFDLNGYTETMKGIEMSYVTTSRIVLGSGSMTFNTAGTGYTFNGIVSGSGSLTKSGSGTLTLAGNNTYTGATTISDGTLQLGAANRIADTSALSVASGATFDMATYAETVASIAGAGNITNNDTSLTAGGDDSSTAFSGVLSGSGSLIKVGNGTLTLSGTNTYSGATTISAGGLSFNAADVLNASSGINMAANTTLTYTGSADTLTRTIAPTGSGVTINASGSGLFTLSGNITGTATDVTLGGTGSGNISGVIGITTGALTKVDANTWTLSGANTYTGATTISDGTLQLGAANRIADTSALSVASGATFDLATYAETVASIAGAGDITNNDTSLTAGGDDSSTAFSGVLSGSGSFTKDGSGTLTLSGANTYTGATTISDGTLLLGTANSIADTSALSVASGATFDLASFAKTFGSIAGAGDIINNDTSLTAGGDDSSTAFSGVLSGSGSFTKDGSGTLTLSGANTYTGTTTVSNGTLTLGTSNALVSAITINGGIFDIGSNSDTVSSVSLVDGSITGTTGTLTSTSDFDVQNGSISAKLDGAVGLTKSTNGTVILSGANSYTDGTTINQGTLSITTDANLGDTAGNVTMGGGTLQTTASFSSDRLISLGSATNNTIQVDTGTLSLNASITGGNALTILNKSGAGTLTMNGDSDYNGRTNINAGTVNVTSANNGLSSGIVGIASGATLTLNDGVSLANNTEINGGSITSSGNASLSGATMTLGDNSSITNTGTLTINSVIGDGAGTYGLNVTNSDGLILLGDNTFKGGFTVSGGGYVDVRHNNAFGSATNSTVSLTNTTLYTSVSNINITNDITIESGAIFGGSVDYTLSGDLLASNNTFTKYGGNRVELSGSNSAFTGTVDITSGTLRVSSANALGASSAGTSITDGATLEINNVNIGIEPIISVKGTGIDSNGAIQGIGVNAEANGVITLIGNTTIGTNDQLVLTGAISGASYAINKVGSGTLELAGNNSYGGGTTLSLGTLTAGSNSAFGGETLTLADNTILTTSGSFDVSNNISLIGASTIGSVYDFSLSGTINGGQALTFANSGNITIGDTINVASVNANPTMTLNGASITTSGTQSYASALTLGSTTALNGTAITTAAIDGAGYALTINNSASSAINGILSGTGTTLTKQGSSVLTLGAANTYTGLTTISAGILRHGVNNAIGSSGIVSLANNATAVYDLNNKSSNIKGLQGGSSSGVSLGTGTLTIGNSTTIYGGTISGDGSVVKNGTGKLTLGGTNTYTGSTTVTGGGNLSISDNRNLGYASAGVDPGGSLIIDNGTLTTTGNVDSERLILINDGGATFSTDASTTLTFNSSLTNGSGTNPHNIIKSGDGTLLLAGSNDYDGTTSIAQGKVRVADNSALSSGNITISNNAALQLETGITIGNTINVTGSGIGGAGAIVANGTNTAVTGNITLANDTTFGATGSNDKLSINSALDDAVNITLAGSGTVALNALLTNATSLTANSKVDIGIANITTSGSQAYNNLVTLMSDTILSGAGLSLSTVARDGIARSLTINSNAGALTLAGTIGTNGSKLSAFSATTNNSGGISIGNNIYANGNVSLVATAGAVSETGAATISGGTLSVNAATGITLTNANSLSSLGTVNAGSGNFIFTNTADITQSGIITANNATLDAGAHAISLGLDNAVSGVISLTNSGTNNITYNNIADTLTIGTSSSGSGTLLITNEGNIATSGTINTAGGDVIISTTSPDTTAKTLTIDHTISTDGGNISLEATNITANDNTAGTATPLIINAVLNSGTGSSGTLTLSGGTALNITPSVGSGDITLNGNGLDLEFGNISFDSNIGFIAARKITLTGNFSTTNNSNITLTANGTNPGEGVILNSGSSISSAGGITLNGLITLNGNLTANNGNIALNGNVDFSTDRTVNANSGNITFTGTVNGASNSLTLQNNTSAAGVVTFNDNVNIGDLITYAQPYSVILNGNSNSFASHVAFTNTNGVTLGNAASDTFTFSGGLSSTASTTTLASVINATNNAAAFNNIILAANSSVTTGTGAITVNGTVSGNLNIALSSGTGTTLNANITVGNLIMNGGGADVFNASSINTTGNQTYSNALTLNNAAAGFSGSALSFANALTGSLTELTVTGSGVVNFGGDVNTKSLVANGSAITTSATNISTTLNQTYTGAITFNNNLNLLTTGTDTRSLTINSGINGNHTLDISSSNADTFNVWINGVISSTGLTISPNSASSNNNLRVNTGGTQIWNINSVDAGSIGGGNINGGVIFSRMQNINGGTSTNTFNFIGGGAISGTVNGSSLSVINSIDLTRYNGSVSLSFNGGNAGVLRNQGSLVADFSNIRNLILGSNIDNTVEITGNNNLLSITAPYSGTLNNTLSFNNIYKFFTRGVGNILYFGKASVNNLDKRSGVITGSVMAFSGFKIFEGNFVLTSEIVNALAQTYDNMNMQSTSNQAVITITQPDIPQFQILKSVFDYSDQFKNINIQLSPNSDTLIIGQPLNQQENTLVISSNESGQ